MQLIQFWLHFNLIYLKLVFICFMHSHFVLALVTSGDVALQNTIQWANVAFSLKKNFVNTCFNKSSLNLLILVISLTAA